MSPRRWSLPAGALRGATIALSLLAAGFLLAWLRLLPHLQRGSDFTDGLHRVALDDGERLRFLVWDAPLLLGPEVNGPEAEGRPAVSPDGRQLVFALGEPGLNAELWIAELVDGQPRDARPLAALNSPFDDLAPAFGPDALWFASNRPGGAGGFDLLRASWRDGELGAPERLPPGLDSEHDELDPAPVPGSRALVYASNAPRGRRSDFHLLLGVPVDGDDAAAAAAPRSTQDASPALGERPAATAARAFRVEALPALDSPFDEREPAFVGGGRSLVFASDRDGGAGGFDLYRSIQDQGRDHGRGTHGEPGTWQAPEPMVGLNSPGSERGPAALGDGFTLLLSVVDTWGAGPDLQRARSRELYRLPGRLPGWLELTIVGLLLLLALLTWLGRRWEALDILAKCLLASLLIHVLLMLWFRDVTVEPEGQPPAPPPAFRVKLSAPAARALASRERAGELAAAPTTRDAATSAPERLRAALPESAPARAAAAAELLAPVLAGAAAPQRAAAESSPVARSTIADPLAQADLAEGAAPASSEAPASLALDDLLPASPATTGPSANRATAQAPSRWSPAQAQPGVERAAAPAAAGAPLDLPAAAAEPLAAPGPRVADGQAAAERRALPGTALTTDVAPVAEALATSSAAAPTAGSTHIASGSAAEAPGTLALGDAREVAPAPRRAASADSADGPARWRDARPPAAGPPLAAAPAPRPLALPGVLAAPLPDAAPPATALDHTPYRNRFGAAREDALAEGGGSPETERAVAAGLAYLASIQRRGGQWGDVQHFDPKYGQVAVGKTALCLLAFLGAGHSPASSREHAGTARRAADFLLSVQDEGSGHFGESCSYSHGIATYALAESYALDRDERLLPALRRAVAWILARQSKERDGRRFGGWGYYDPQGPSFDAWPRTAITAWQVMALESARLGGLAVPDQAFLDARAFLHQAHDEAAGVVLYNRDPERLASAYPTLPGSTPGGLFALALLGEDLDAPRWRTAVEFTLARRPRGYRPASERDFVALAAGNLYFWYCGSLALFRHGGTEWEQWNRALQATLLPSQAGDGSWPPIDLYARYAGDDDRDRSYTTALCVLNLEVYYRYVTPLLRVDLPR